MYVPEIIQVKEHLETLKNKKLILQWELPYENLLTRRSAAIFFLNPVNDNVETLASIWKELSAYDNFSQRHNQEKKLSVLPYRITFSAEEKEKNSTPVKETQS